MNEIKLRPCPFCGGEAEMFGRFHYRYEGIENRPLSNNNDNYKGIIKHIAENRFNDIQHFSVVCTECGCTVYGYGIPHGRILVPSQPRKSGLINSILIKEAIEKQKIDMLEHSFKSAVEKWNNRVDDVDKQSET